MLDFLATLLGWLGFEGLRQSENDSVEDVTTTHEDESNNLLGIMIPDG